MSTMSVSKSHKHRWYSNDMARLTGYRDRFGLHINVYAALNFRPAWYFLSALKEPRQSEVCFALQERKKKVLPLIAVRVLSPWSGSRLLTLGLVGGDGLEYEFSRAAWLDK